VTFEVGEILKNIGNRNFEHQNIKIGLPNAKIRPKTINFHRFLFFFHFFS